LKCNHRTEINCDQVYPQIC